MRKVWWGIGCAGWLLWGSACANRGSGPQGGPRDTIAPAVVKETPVNGVTGYKGKNIEIQFDEYVQLADIQKNVIISPPQQNAPSIKAFGKRVMVEFEQELKDSTTYTIDFGAAICDYNEKTPLKDYSFAFSTGEHIDSLMISGIVVDAQNLNSVGSVLVGIHANPADSALSTEPFMRITRSDNEGYFTIRNIREGAYRIYALNDISRDYLYQPGEGLAFADTLIKPRVDITTVIDTLWRDTMVVDTLSGDTLHEREIEAVDTAWLYVYEPYDVVLWYFAEQKQRHYFQGVHRDEPHQFTMMFSAPSDSVPQWRALRPADCDTAVTDTVWTDWTPYCICKHSMHHDTLTFWLTDSAAIRQDTLCMELRHAVTDSLYHLVWKTDTVRAVYRAPRMSDKARAAKQREKENRKLELHTNGSTKFEIFDTLTLTSGYPIDSIAAAGVRLRKKVDTTWVPVDGHLVARDSLSMRLQYIAKLEPEQDYEWTIDSASFYDVYGKCNDAAKVKIHVKSKEDYSTLIVKIVHFDPRIRLQLLDGKDNVMKELPALKDGTKFEYLAPTEYYMRLYVDENGDGKWTTGDWMEGRQPEKVWYFPRKLKLRANWDFEETFDHWGVPQLDSKPSALRPKAK